MAEAEGIAAAALMIRTDSSGMDDTRRCAREPSPPPPPPVPLAAESGASAIRVSERRCSDGVTG